MVHAANPVPAKCGSVQETKRRVRVIISAIIGAIGGIVISYAVHAIGSHDALIWATLGAIVGIFASVLFRFDEISS